MTLLSIGEFAALTGLSPKWLRRYDSLGLLPPAAVDPLTGYRWYAPAQADRARLVAALRRLRVPPARIGAVLALDPPAAARELAAHWAAQESDHAARAELARHLIATLEGTASAMPEVATREIPERTLLTVHRHATRPEVAELGRALYRRFHAEPRIPGVAGAPFITYHGRVTADADGPVTFSWPVHPDRAPEHPDLTLAVEPAHEEAYVPLTRDGHLSDAAALVSSLHTWLATHHRTHTAPLRQLFLPGPYTTGTLPDCDFAYPLG